MPAGHQALWATGLLLLAGCGKADEVALTNASPREVAAKVDAVEAMRLEPGQWETRVTVSDIAMPDMPAGVGDQVRSAMKQQANTVITNCITPEQAANPRGEVFGGGGSQCRYRRFTMTAGRIDAEMDCSGSGGGAMTLKTEGRFTPTSFEVDNAMQMGGTGAPSMSMKARVVGRRIGQCPA